jgi:excisionase family DNA binding protein
MPAPNLLAEPLLDAREAAKLLHVPRSTLYELVRSRGLPHVKVGRGLRFTRADLGCWVAENSYGQGARRRR